MQHCKFGYFQENMSGSLTNRDPVEAPAGIQIKPKANAKSNLPCSIGKTKVLSQNIHPHKSLLLLL